MEKIYLLVRCSGEYEDYRNDILFGVDSRSIAELYQAKANSIFPKLYRFYSDWITEINKSEWSDDTNTLWNTIYEKADKFNGSVYIWETDIRQLDFKKLTSKSSLKI